MITLYLSEDEAAIILAAIDIAENESPMAFELLQDLKQSIIYRTES